MTVIGICGGSGSGKSSVSDIFREFGYATVNTDEIYHELTSFKTPCLDDLAREFGADIITEGGALNRPKLASIVFADGAESRQKRLNEITHFHVLTRVREIITQENKKGTAGVAVDVPLLFESGFNKECDITVAVIADRKERVKRICKRDGISREAAEARINAQLSDEYLISNTDFVLINNKDLVSLKKQVIDLIEKIDN